MTSITSFALRAGLALGLLRAVWITVEHLVGARTIHLEWVEPSYGLYLLIGVPLTWVLLLRGKLGAQGQGPQTLKELLLAGLGAGLVSGLIHVGVFALYTEVLNPDYLDAFVSWNVDNSSNTFEVANREFRLPAFLDILLVHPLIANPLFALLASRARPRTTS